jgi:hypothetical protein
MAKLGGPRVPISHRPQRVSVLSVVLFNGPLYAEPGRTDQATGRKRRMSRITSRLWKFAVIVSVMTAVAGGALLLRAGMIADASNSEDNFHPGLWAIFGSGIVGAVVSFPAVLARRRNHP